MRKKSASKLKGHSGLSREEMTTIWTCAIGLQDVDHLQVSPFLRDLADQTISGELSLDQAARKLHRHYALHRPMEYDCRTEEADQAALKAVQILLDPTFEFSIEHYLRIHRTLFSGIYKFAGKTRDYNISKAEPVLGGASVLYGNWLDLSMMLEYDLAQEKAFCYQGLSAEEFIRHLAIFTSNLWQIHPFGEGNTRTTAIFLIQYLRSLGWNPQIKVFGSRTRDFRNALVHASYDKPQNGHPRTTVYVELLLKELLPDLVLEMLSQPASSSAGF